MSLPLHVQVSQSAIQATPSGGSSYLTGNQTPDQIRQFVAWHNKLFAAARYRAPLKHTSEAYSYSTVLKERPDSWPCVAFDLNQLI